MLERHAMEVTMNRNRFNATAGLPVVVYEYWTVKGNLIKECVPAADAYNIARINEYERDQVGSGVMVEEADAGRWGSPDWIVEWQRTSKTPPFPRAYRFWKLRTFLHTLHLIWQLRGDWETMRWVIAARLQGRSVVFMPLERQ